MAPARCGNATGPGPAYPVYYLDFETILPAIPRYAGMRPYQTIPFQWSVYVRHADGRLEHSEWLCDSGRDPSRETDWS